jgi:localization factor PodJL
MTRTATLNLEGFDPDVLEAARDVARRAGIPVETWIASIVDPEAAARAATGEQRQPTPPMAQAPAEIPPAPPVQAAAAHLRATAPPFQAAAAEPAPVATSAPAPAPAAAGIDSALSEMMQRLDAIDERMRRESQASQDAASRTIAGIEARLGAAAQPAAAPSELVDRLSEIERRMTEIGSQLAQPRPLGRRGRAAETEIRDAVSEIRQRQRELATGTAPEPQAPEGQAPEGQAPKASSPAIAELQNETSRLRESIGGLASGRDVGALEQAMRALAAGVQRAQAPSDLAAIAAPIELIRVQVARLAEDVAENVHARVAADVERLAAKVDGALHSAPAGFAEQDVLGGLFRELDEIRRLIGALAGPERIQSLASGLQTISTQIAQLHDGKPGEAGSLAELRPLLEEIRSGLRSGPDSGIGEQIQEMGAKLDALRGSAPMGTGAQSDAILHRLDALSEQVERVHINPVGDLIGRLEDLGATLRRPAAPEEDFASIRSMLHDLTVKLDRVGTGDGPRDEGLDALEQQVLALAQRIDTRDADPALAGLERTMSDLLDQVSALRAEAPIEAAVERAARNAVAESIGAVADPEEVGLLRASLADLRAHQVASEQRMQSTLNGVYSALERLVGRLGTLEGEAASTGSGRPGRDSIPERVPSERPPLDRAGPRSDGPRGSRPAIPAALHTGPDLPLEPGAGRPGRERAAESVETLAVADSDIKTSFIAAARRAAQAAQAEAAGQSIPLDPPEARDAAQAPERGGRLARLRGEIDRRRKPLLLGLAAIVLALGALQAVNARRSTGAVAPAMSEAATLPPAAESAPATTQALADEPAPAKAAEAKAAEAKAPAEPQTAQSLAETPGAAIPANPAKSGPDRAGPPKVPALASLSGDLAGVPPALGKLRQATLDGDAAAAYDLATRASEARGMPRDNVMAARILEKVAASGYAPAQYKLASLHEKGVGLPRDLVQAKLWYGRAAELGNARAMHNLAVIYAETPTANGKPDFATASQWFKRGAEFGLRDSQYNLAVLYARGLGVQQDLEQSYLWFSAASAQGDSDAAKKRDDVAAKLDPKALAAAKGQVAAFMARTPDPAANEPPAPFAIENSMSLLGAPPPSPGATPPARRI